MSNSLKLKVRKFYGQAPSLLELIIRNLNGEENSCTYVPLSNQHISPKSG